MAKIGIIGGTGLDNPEFFQERQEKEVMTPFGKTSDNLILGKINGISCVLLSRHGRKHTINPTNINYRANIWALKEEGCSCIIATTACGSLQDNVHPGDIVLLDQFFDRTTKRVSTFYDGAPTSPLGVCHISMAQPFSSVVRKMLRETLDELGVKNYHPCGTSITIEGPRFSTKAESVFFKSIGAHVINMTTVPEVVLAKEAAIPYASIALVTDYDCWKEDESSHVSVEIVMNQMKANAVLCEKILLAVVPRAAAFDWEPIKREHDEAVRCSTMN